MDSTDQMIKATELLIDKYKGIIDRYEMNWTRLHNFLCKQEPEYKAKCDEYLLSNN